jgi:hypothetical protein
MIVLKTIAISLVVIWTMSLIMFFVYEREFYKNEERNEHSR